MAISTNHGPLIESGTIDGAVYELHGDLNPILYVYRKVGGRYAEKATQLAGMPVEKLARQLLAELPMGRAT